MWRCSQCDESVDDTFDVCWNCGAAIDGTVNPGFRPEPDDPAVPDPGEDADSVPTSVSAQFDATQDSSCSGGMNRREIAALICKTLALILFAVAAVLTVTVVLLLVFMLLAAPYGHSPDTGELFIFFVAAVPVLATVGVAIIYWTKSETIASLMVTADPSPVTIQPFNVQDAMIVAFSTAGIFFFLDGVRDVVRIVYVLRESSIAASEFWYHFQTWSAIIQLTFALWLILGSRGIVAAIHWCRTAGVPHERNESEDKNVE